MRFVTELCMILLIGCLAYIGFQGVQGISNILYIVRWH